MRFGSFDVVMFVTKQNTWGPLDISMRLLMNIHGLFFKVFHHTSKIDTVERDSPGTDSASDVVPSKFSDQPND
ncbi:MAG: hypothetical protein Q9175_002563 [Cornicularia normoerica]